MLYFSLTYECRKLQFFIAHHLEVDTLILQANKVLLQFCQCQSTNGYSLQSVGYSPRVLNPPYTGNSQSGGYSLFLTVWIHGTSGICPEMCVYKNSYKNNAMQP